MQYFKGIAESAKVVMGCVEESPKSGKRRDQCGSGKTSHRKSERRGIKGAGSM